MLIFKLRGFAVLTVAALLLFGENNTSATVRLPKVFSSHMVLQQQKPIIIWGWADPNEEVTVQISSSKSSPQTSGANGRFLWPP